MKRAFGLLVIGLIATAFAKDPNIEGGKIHYRDGRYEKADALFIKALSGSSAEEAYFWHGKASVRLNNPVEAARAFLHALDSDPTGNIIRNDEEGIALAKIAFRYGAIDLFDDTLMQDTVVIFLKKGIELDPKETFDYVLLGRFYLQNDKGDEAIKVAEDLEKVVPASPQVPYIKARVSLSKEEYEKSIEYFNDAIAAYKKELGELEEKIASQLERKIEEIHPVLASLDSMESAKDSVPPAEKENFLVSNIGFLPPQAKNFLKWRSGYIAQRHETSVAYSYLGQAYFWTKKYPEADTAFSNALEFDTENTDAAWYKGFNYFYLRDYKNAIVYFEKSIDTLNPNPTIYLYLGICYLKDETKDLDKAGEFLFKAEELDNENPDVYLNLTVYWREKGDLQKASEAYKRAQELSKQGDNQ
ncbi:tetratricopeptide repeat protein [bacterium]|nr:tetratricopeptide repeat protein [bacterium]